MSDQRFDVTAMCLTCGTTRHARAVRSDGWVVLFRPELRCKTCATTTTHAVADKTARYGWREDGLRQICGETNRLLATLELMPNVDLRWSEGDWCLAHIAIQSPSLEWLSDHPGEDSFPCICEEPPRGRPEPGVGGIGAQPAGRVVPHRGRFVVELDTRVEREELAGPLRGLLERLAAGQVTRAAYLSPAYSVSAEAYMLGKQIAERRRQSARQRNEERR